MTCGRSCYFGQQQYYRSRFEYLERFTAFNMYQSPHRHRRPRIYCYPGCSWYGPTCRGSNRFNTNRCAGRCNSGFLNGNIGYLSGNVGNIY